MEKNTNADDETVTGFVSLLSVSGVGPNSAEIVVSICHDGDESSYAVFTDSTPQVFSSFVSLLTAAYLSKTKIDLSYVTERGSTPKISAIVFPSATP